MNVKPIRWRSGKVELIDQRLLPGRTKYVACNTARDMFAAIREMKIRGAPAIGIAGAYGVYLGIRKSRAKDFRSFKKDLAETTRYLAGSRPTARNLFWALERITRAAEKNKDKKIKELKKIILNEAHKILEEDAKICRSIGENGKKLLSGNSTVLTHCNAGGLATGGYGTALGVVFSARSKIKRVYVDETRPRLQGARLTVWELMKEKIPVTLICDNMAASFMAKKEFDAIIVGADRIAANGDTANKVGTYNLAVLANYHKVPFYVAAPVSTFDLSISSGAKIPIEERSALEVKRIGREYITPKKMKVRNPAFDVTPAKLITAIITERGAIRKPDRKKIRRVLGTVHIK
ncbi:MAG: S-methyl-5-thioribose-1-phosphate isomerase [Candidatus Omnitrophota bacterium]